MNLIIVEIDDITKVGSNLSAISPIEYTIHNTLIKSHTLLYHQGKFRTNAQEAYPIVNNYTYTGVNIPDKYDAGSLRYDQNGDSVTNSNGYKWIGFKFDIQSVNGADAQCIARTSDGDPFVDITTLSQFFENGNAIINKLIQNGSQTLKATASDNILVNEDVIGFVVHDVDNITRIGRLDANLNTTSLWFGAPGDKSYYDAFHGASKNSYGSILKSADETQFGPGIKVMNLLGDRYVYIYIGIINTCNMVNFI